MVLVGGADAAYRERLGRGGGTWRHRVEVWWDGIRADPFGDDGVPLVSGSVSVNLANRVTRSLSVTVPAELFPFDTGDLLSPMGAQLRVYAGWRFGSMVPDWFPVFVGPVTSAGPVSPRSAEFELSATDLAEGVIQDRFLVSRVPPVGALSTDEYRKLILETYPQITFGRVDDQYTTVPDVAWNSDRAGACDAMATAASCFWFFDGSGAPTWRRIPWTAPSFDTADLTLTDETGLQDLALSLSRTGVYNVVVVTGRGLDSSTPVYGQAMDLDVTSATYVEGPMGGRVLEVSEEVATLEQADSLARLRLTRARAVSRSVTATLLADPSLELCDIIDLEQLGWSIRAALTSYTIPLAGGRETMECMFREAGGAIDAK